MRRHPDPDVRFVAFKTIVDFIISMENDGQIAQKIISALPRDIQNVYLLEWNNSEIKTPLAGQEFNINIALNPYA